MVSPSRLIKAQVRDTSDQLGVTPRKLELGSELSSGIPRMIRWTFLVFVFSVPFDSTTFGFMSPSLSLAKLLGFLFFASCLTSPRKCFSRLPHVIWWFFGYLLIFLFSSLFSSEFFLQNILIKFLTRLQLILLLWVAYNLMQEEEITKNTLLIYTVSSSLLALVMLAGVAGFSEVTEYETFTRTTVFGEDPNMLAVKMALAVVMGIGIVLHKINHHSWEKILVIALLPSLIVGILATGSRTGAASLIIGSAVYLLPSGRARRKITTIVLAFFSLIALVYIVAHDSSSSSRWSQTYHEGKTSGRDRIYQAAIEMAKERPIFGWQPEAFLFELEKRVQERGTGLDPHNLYLYLLLEVGIVGAAPFLIGLWLCVQSAWKGRAGRLATLPLAALLTVLSANLAIIWMTRKPMWIVLAMTLAASHHRLHRYRTKHIAAVPTRSRA
ncbi:MAG: O-antigen ligase family protein [Candidatus Tectomicrobia bacterium]|nr:O-antigen ligase family protein [Candidatus Tectomicrobia bacterium]